MGMMYRQLLVGSSKGDLGPVWMAAHFPKRLRKDQVEQTNISSSVDKILVDQLPAVTYRILGFLLLGVTRMYLKKVEYLLLDCNNCLNEMRFHFEGRKKININLGGMCSPESSNQRSILNVVDMPVSKSSSRKRRNTFVEAMRAQFSSISLPENFELDAFDLEVVEDESSEDHVKSHVEITLKDAWENDRTAHCTFSKDHVDSFPSFGDCSSAYAMIRSIKPSNSETSAEKLRHRFSLDECLDIMVLDETDEVDLPVRPSTEQEPEWKNTKSLDNYMMFEDGEHPDREEHRDNKDLDEECTTGETMVSEMTLVDNIMLKPSPDKRLLSVNINVTPQSKAAVVSGEYKPDFMSVRTPATKERVRAPRKRKCVCDDMIVVPKNVYKDWLADASDLVGKRRKPRATFLAWKDHRLFDLSQSFLEPIIPINAGFSPDRRSVSSGNKPVLLEIDKVRVEKESESVMHKTCEEREAEAMAPSTPVTQSVSLRFNEIQEASKANEVGPTSSSEELIQIQDEELDEFLTEEVPSSLGEHNQENVLVAEKWSSLTKSLASCLRSNFVHRKGRGEEEAVILSRILKQKTKKESARFFSELLVLKTGGYVDVKQEKAYDDICVMQTSKLEEVFEASS